MLLTLDRTMDDQPVTDQDIEALIDNELGWEDEKRVRRHLAQDPRAQSYFESLREQKRLLLSWWDRHRKH